MLLLVHSYNEHVRSTMPINSIISIPVKREPMLYHVSMATLFLSSRLWPGIMLHIRTGKDLSACQVSVTLAMHLLTIPCGVTGAMHYTQKKIIDFICIFTTIFSPINALLGHSIGLRFPFIISLIFSSKCNYYSIYSFHKYSTLFYSMSTVFA